MPPTAAAATSTSTTTSKTFDDLLTTIGCETETIQAIKKAGLTSLEDLSILKEGDLKTLCEDIYRKGTVPISFMAELRLKLILSEVKIRQYINCPLDTILQADTETIASWRTREALMSTLKDPIDDAPTASEISKNWIKGIETLEYWISRHVDEVTGIPLAFAVRHGPPDTSEYKSTNYSSLCEEFEKRTRLSDEENRDFEWAGPVRVKVWNILYPIFKDHPAFECIKPFQREMDGPAAFAALRKKYLINNLANLASDIDAEFDALTYTQESKRWDFEKYVTKHMELYYLSQALVPYGYHGIDPASRVQRLLSGIKTDTLDSVMIHVFGNDNLLNDFDQTVKLLKDFIGGRNSHQDHQKMANPTRTGKRKSTDSGCHSKRRNKNKGG
ncbi:hypothetical protein IV203_030336 [Nitzschia inconspicua]|uniref:Uncharacterized protein n=1 Tax=Nitzschia inconspicua TaxID=303405 RepID=A0A9K3LTJ7_9STRA|nr:hypothetical protein IV203_030336 [Nitzschia inconspicua]